MENNSELKYQYHAKLWGGFYNDEYRDIHKHNEGDFLFNTAIERQIYIDQLKAIEKEMKAFSLVVVFTEGYCCDTRTVLHRVSEYKGKQYYTTNDLGINFQFDVAKYILQWKWYPGCNDYPLGEEFDYEKNKVEIVKQWITGSFEDVED